MPCDHPIRAWVDYGAGINPKTGKYPMTFNMNTPGIRGEDCVLLPCGRCRGCRLEKSRQWAVRMMHEARMHQDNCFVTLTYDNDHLPGRDRWPGGTLCKRDVQLWMKRLRKEIEPTHVRYYLCGEYGDLSGRAHYHAALFGFRPSDGRLLSRNGGNPLYTSRTLESVWPAGLCSFGQLSFESAAYVSRYVTKKQTGHVAPEHYQGRVPEFALMSRRPGIGEGWFKAFGGDTYPNDFVVARGHKCKPPRYYDKLLERADPDGFDLVKALREERHKDDAPFDPLEAETREEFLRLKDEFWHSSKI